MKIKDILKSVDNPKIKNLEVSGLADDSRDLVKNSLFFVIEKPNFNIFSVLTKIELQVTAYVADIKNKDKINSLVKNKPVIYLQGIESCFYRTVKKLYKPKPNLKIIGITGTNGKTSTAYFLYQLLKRLGKKVALFTTVGYFFNSVKYNASHTTAGFLRLAKMIKKASNENIEYLIIEVSSHGIDQGRIRGIRFQRSVFTNVSRDHLDYHKTMRAYFNTKKSFFIQNQKNYLIINKDCDYGKKLLLILNKTISYGIKNKADYQAKDIKLARSKTEFNLYYKDKVFPLSFKIPGYYNVLNVLAAVAVAHSLGFSLLRLAKKISFLKRVEGRFQEVLPNIFVDYAHTPEGLKNILFSLKQIGYQRIISVFGCGGQRDKGKREVMGKISSQLADFTIITSDNPRGENPLNICKQIKRGCVNDKFKIIVDRGKAIKKSIELYAKDIKSGQKSCVLVAGKGHEGYQIFAHKKVSFKDAKVIKDYGNYKF